MHANLMMNIRNNTADRKARRVHKIRIDMDQFYAGYVEAMLWASIDDNGDPLDDHCDSDDLHPETAKKAMEDCHDFVRDCLKQGIRLNDIAEPSQHGHDLWLTRNGHGAGFWDRGYGAVGEQLSEIARHMGSVDPYIGADALIHTL